MIVVYRTRVGPLGPYTFRGSLMWSPPDDCGYAMNKSNCSVTGGVNNHQGMFEFPAGSGKRCVSLWFLTLSRHFSATFDCVVLHSGTSRITTASWREIGTSISAISATSLWTGKLHALTQMWQCLCVITVFIVPGCT